jgi:peptidoglycan hydrolase-like protein with peptidoglycan-binding domain
MAKTLAIMLSILLLSACATVNEDSDSQIAETQGLPTPEIQPFESSAQMPVEPAKNELTGSAKKLPSKQEIKSIQAQLRAAGFEPGPLDGTLGAKTLSALHRLQSGCANLKDLFENPTNGILPQSGQQNASDKDFSSDEIRMIQVRLKDAGFDVGPVDGMMGSKTKAALVRFKSGCTMVKDLPPFLDGDARISERMPSPIPTSERQIQSTSAKVPPAMEAVKDEAGKVNMAADKSPSREEIRLLQTQLKAAGFDPGALDGMLGPKTKSALQQYRTASGPSASRKVSSDVGLKFDY